MSFTRNGLVAALSPADQRALRAACELTPLTANRMLSSSEKAARNAYFLTGASVALLTSDGSNTGAAVGLVGLEGAVGLQFGLGLGPSRFGLLVQTQGPAWMISGGALQRIVQSRPSMLLALARYLWSVGEELAEFASAVQQQTVSQRLATWILRSQAADPNDALLLTHSHIASMLGVRRASVSAAANEMRDLGLLDYSRGRIQVLNRRKLLALSLALR